MSIKPKQKLQQNESRKKGNARALNLLMSIGMSEYMHKASAKPDFAALYSA